MFSSYYMDRRGRVYPNQESPEDVRVAVIPFEDREQVERLAKGLPVSWILFQPDDPAVGEDSVTAMQAALREFANPTPPKPEEPTGLGAVVEDAGGRSWVKTHHHWRNADLVGISWDDLAAVRVLSEGVES